MSTQHIYAIYDKLAGYTALIPFTGEHHKELAKDFLIDHIIDNPQVRNHPDRYSIWHIGTFDKDSGTFIQRKEDLKKIMEAEDYTNGYKKRTL